MTIDEAVVEEAIQKASFEPKPRFHVTNFGGNVTSQMNEPFACLLYDAILELRGIAESTGKTIPKELNAFAEKIENQFFWMGRFGPRRT